MKKFFLSLTIIFTALLFTSNAVIFASDDSDSAKENSESEKEFNTCKKYVYWFGGAVFERQQEKTIRLCEDLETETKKLESALSKREFDSKDKIKCPIEIKHGKYSPEFDESEITSLSVSSSYKDYKDLNESYRKAMFYVANANTDCDENKYVNAMTILGQVIENFRLKIATIQFVRKVHGGEPMLPDAKDVFNNVRADFAGVAGLKDYTGGELDGGKQFRNIIERIISYIKQLTYPIAILMVAYAGFSLYLAREGSTDTFDKKRIELIWMTVGFLLFALAANLIDHVFFGVGGEILKGDADQTIEFASRGFQEIEALFQYAVTFGVIISVAFIVITALSLIFAAGEDEAQITKAKYHLVFGSVGIAVLVSARPIVGIIAPEGHIVVPDAKEFVDFILSWSNFLLGLIGLFAVITLIYGGARLILDYGSGEAQESAKKIIIASVIGLILTFSSWAIVNFFIIVQST